jgi:hypothetical protein
LGAGGIGLQHVLVFWIVAYALEAVLPYAEFKVGIKLWVVTSWPFFAVRAFVGINTCGSRQELFPALPGGFDDLFFEPFKPSDDLDLYFRFLSGNCG